MSTPDSPEPRSLPLGLSSLEELEELLQQIHDNVYSRPLLSTQMTPLADHISQMDTPLLPPPPPGLLELIHAIRSAQAPYYVVSGNFLARWMKQIHNLVLKLFGRKQAYYNTLTLDLLENTVTYLHTLQEHSRAQASLIEALTRQVMLQTEQLADLQVTTRQEGDQQMEALGKRPASQENEKL